MTPETPGETEGVYDGDRKVVVGAGSFAQFDAWMDEQLEKLVARWSHLSAPNAGQPRRKIPRHPK